jgi:hypothetical protein
MLYQLYLEKYKDDVKKTEKKISSEKQKLIKKIIFDKYLVQSEKSENITKFYTMQKLEKKKTTKIYKPINYKKTKQQSIKDWLNN